eukprot:9149096-Alexandrium_andersonii.AAC.1
MRGCVRACVRACVARGGGGPSVPNGPNGPPRRSELAKVGDPRCLTARDAVVRTESDGDDEKHPPGGRHMPTAAPCSDPQTRGCSR